MLQTHRAILRGTQVIWLDSPPQLSEDAEVHITVLKPVSVSALSHQGSEMATSLRKLAQLSPFHGLDPVEWQKKNRQDRSLPGREA
ncbi:hypothetical protein [Vasconcelosia minhoensis]|uniref:hypothetical protein n=1 Tax=Vasconcelosia minhoensis TaxID=3366354 RepID=UPI00188160F7|nr:hypothetical protein [Romeria gracilis]